MTDAVSYGRASNMYAGSSVRSHSPVSGGDGDAWKSVKRVVSRHQKAQAHQVSEDEQFVCDCSFGCWSHVMRYAALSFISPIVIAVGHSVLLIVFLASSADLRQEGALGYMWAVLACSYAFGGYGAFRLRQRQRLQEHALQMGREAARRRKRRQRRRQRQRQRSAADVAPVGSEPEDALDQEDVARHVELGCCEANAAFIFAVCVPVLAVCALLISASVLDRYGRSVTGDLIAPCVVAGVTGPAAVLVWAAVSRTLDRENGDLHDKPVLAPLSRCFTWLHTLVCVFGVVPLTFIPMAFIANDNDDTLGPAVMCTTVLCSASVAWTVIHLLIVVSPSPLPTEQSLMTESVEQDSFCERVVLFLQNLWRHQHILSGIVHVLSMLVFVCCASVAFSAPRDSTGDVAQKYSLIGFTAATLPAFLLLCVPYVGWSSVSRAWKFFLMGLFIVGGAAVAFPLYKVARDSYDETGREDWLVQRNFLLYVMLTWPVVIIIWNTLGAWLTYDYTDQRGDQSSQKSQGLMSPSSYDLPVRNVKQHPLVLQVPRVVTRWQDVGSPNSRVLMKIPVNFAVFLSTMLIFLLFPLLVLLPLAVILGPSSSVAVLGPLWTCALVVPLLPGLYMGVAYAWDVERRLRQLRSSRWAETGVVLLRSFPVVTVASWFISSMLIISLLLLLGFLNFASLRSGSHAMLLVLFVCAPMLILCGLEGAGATPQEAERRRKYLYGFVVLVVLPVGICLPVLLLVSPLSTAMEYALSTIVIGGPICFVALSLVWLTSDVFGSDFSVFSFCSLLCCCCFLFPFAIVLPLVLVSELGTQFSIGAGVGMAALMCLMGVCVGSIGLNLRIRSMEYEKRAKLVVHSLQKALKHHGIRVSLDVGRVVYEAFVHGVAIVQPDQAAQVADATPGDNKIDMFRQWMLQRRGVSWIQVAGRRRMRLGLAEDITQEQADRRESLERRVSAEVNMHKARRVAVQKQLAGSYRLDGWLSSSQHETKTTESASEEIQQQKTATQNPDNYTEQRLIQSLLTEVETKQDPQEPQLHSKQRAHDRAVESLLPGALAAPIASNTAEFSSTSGPVGSRSKAYADVMVALHGHNGTDQEDGLRKRGVVTDPTVAFTGVSATSLTSVKKSRQRNKRVAGGMSVPLSRSVAAEERRRTKPVVATSPRNVGAAGATTLQESARAVTLSMLEEWDDTTVTCGSVLRDLCVLYCCGRVELSDDDDEEDALSRKDDVIAGGGPQSAKNESIDMVAHLDLPGVDTHVEEMKSTGGRSLRQHRSGDRAGADAVHAGGNGTASLSQPSRVPRNPHESGDLQDLSPFPSSVAEVTRVQALKQEIDTLPRAQMLRMQAVAPRTTHTRRTGSTASARRRNECSRPPSRKPPGTSSPTPQLGAKHVALNRSAGSNASILVGARVTVRARLRWKALRERIKRSARGRWQLAVPVNESELQLVYRKRLLERIFEFYASTARRVDVIQGERFAKDYTVTTRVMHMSLPKWKQLLKDILLHTHGVPRSTSEMLWIKTTKQHTTAHGKTLMTFGLFVEACEKLASAVYPNLPQANADSPHIITPCSHSRSPSVSASPSGSVGQKHRRAPSGSKANPRTPSRTRSRSRSRSPVPQQRSSPLSATLPAQSPGTERRHQHNRARSDTVGQDTARQKAALVESLDSPRIVKHVSHPLHEKAMAATDMFLLNILFPLACRAPPDLCQDDYLRRTRPVFAVPRLSRFVQRIPGSVSVSMEDLEEDAEAYPAPGIAYTPEEHVALQNEVRELNEINKRMFGWRFRAGSKPGGMTSADHAFKDDKTSGSSHPSHRGGCCGSCGRWYWTNCGAICHKGIVCCCGEESDVLDLTALAIAEEERRVALLEQRKRKEALHLKREQKREWLRNRAWKQCLMLLSFAPGNLLGSRWEESEDDEDDGAESDDSDSHEAPRIEDQTQTQFFSQVGQQQDLGGVNVEAIRYSVWREVEVPFSHLSWAETVELMLHVMNNESASATGLPVHEDIQVEWGLGNVMALLAMALECWSLCALAFSDQVPWELSESSSQTVNLPILASLSDPETTFPMLFWAACGVAILYPFFALPGIGLARAGTLGLSPLTGRAASWREPQFYYATLLSFLGETLYLPILIKLVQSFACVYDSTDDSAADLLLRGVTDTPAALPYLYAQPSLGCWSSGQHVAYASVAFVGVVLYYPMSSFMYPNMQFADRSLDIKFDTTFLIVVAQAKLFLAGLASFFPARPYTLLLCAAVVCTILAWMNHELRPCLVKRVNSFRTASFITAGWACICGLVVTFTENTTLSYVLLFLGWVLIWAIVVVQHLMKWGWPECSFSDEEEAEVEKDQTASLDESIRPPQQVPPDCGNCDSSRANVRCSACKQVFCDSCDARLHHPHNFSTHERQRILAVSDTTKSLEVASWATARPTTST